MDTRIQNRAELASFLRKRREALSPAAVSLPAGVRRRTPGLRRDEVAELASISTNYYERLEQRRAPQPSPTVLAAIARGACGSALRSGSICTCSPGNHHRPGAASPVTLTPDSSQRWNRSPSRRSL